jgi:hypothetical protein
MDNYGQIDADTSIKFLQTPPISNWSAHNCQSIVFDATDLELWVATANSTTPAYLREYIHLSFHDLFPERADVKKADLNGDGTVNIFDIYIMAKAFNSEHGHPRWNEAADINKDGIVNIEDVYLMAKAYGKTLK